MTNSPATTSRLERQAQSDIEMMSRMTKLLNRYNRQDHATVALIDRWEKQSRDHAQYALDLRAQWETLSPEERKTSDLLGQSYRVQEVGRDFARFAEELKEARNVES